EYVQSNFAAESSDREVAQVVVQEENVFEKETLIRTLELQQLIRSPPSVEPTLAEERETAGIANVLATAAYRYRHGDDAEPTLDEQVATLDGLSQQEVDLLVEQLLGNKGGSSEALAFLPEGYEPGLPHASATMIVVFQTVDEEYPGSAAPEYVVESHLAIQSLGEESELDTLVVGNGIFTDEEQRALDDTMSLIGPVALVLVVLVLALAYRDVLDVLLGLAGIVLVQLWTFGTLGWLGIPFNPILVAVPVLLIGLSIDYCIHVFMRYRESRDSDGHRSGIDGAMRAGLAGIGVALVWVTVTTSVGFLSNLASPVGPIRDLGLVAAIGIVGSFVVFVLLVPPLKVELDTQLERFGLDRRNPPIGTGGGRIGELLSVGATAAQRAPVVVVLVVLAVTALTTVAAANVSTSWGPEENMVDGAPGWADNLPAALQPGEYQARDDLEYVEDNFLRHGSEIEILVRGDVTDPATLQRVASARVEATRQESVAKLAGGEVRSTDPLTSMEQVATEDEAFAAQFESADRTGNGVPDTDIEALYDSLFEIAPDRAGEVLHREEGEYVAVRMSISADPEAAGSEVDEGATLIAEKLAADGVTVSTTGGPVIGHVVQQKMLDTLLTSFALTLGAVLVVLVVVFRVVHGSATLGVVTLLPVTAAVSWIIGTMYLLGYPLSILNTIIASLTIGIGIDYSIHVTERFRAELARSREIESAVATTVRGTGGALLGSAATTAVVALAIHPPLQQFGAITAIMIGYAFLGAVLVLPSLLVLWARYRDRDPLGIGLDIYGTGRP
ncbi:Patched family protein, partial [Halobacteriales archaeon QH_10_65_19]